MTLTLKSDSVRNARCRIDRSGKPWAVFLDYIVGTTMSKGRDSEVKSDGLAGAPEIEVTPEMIRAGLEVLANYNPRNAFPDDQVDLVSSIYRAMESRRC